MLVAGRGEPGDVLLIHRPAFGSKLVDHGGHVDRVPGHHSPTDGIDTTTPAGRFFFHVMASLAQMERELLAERTRAGLAAARRRGRLGGRKRRITPGKVESARRLLKGGMSPRDVPPEPRRLDPDAVSLGARIESMSHQDRDAI